jgi:3-oxoacyl-[acyl-carrier protein] reductase
VDPQLKDHGAIVIGSSAGIGKATARSLAAEGAVVIVHGRRAARKTWPTSRPSSPAR